MGEGKGGVGTRLKEKTASPKSFRGHDENIENTSYMGGGSKNEREKGTGKKYTILRG